MTMRHLTTRILTVAAIAAISGHLLAQAPANDDCTGATPISQGMWGPFNNSTATISAQPWTCGTGAGGPSYDVWYSYTAPASGTLSVSLCTGTGFDSVLEVYDAAAGCGGLVSLACNDDGCAAGGPSVVTGIPVTSGGTYYIRVGGWGNATYSYGNYQIDVNGPLPSGSIVATNTNLGAGCLASYSSFYEHFTTTPSIDLSNSAFQMIFTGGSYIVLPAPASSFVAPSATAISLGLGDDTAAPVALSAPFPYPGGTTTSFEVCSNGHVSVATNGAAGDYTPSPADFLGWANPTWAVWRDFICTAAGNVKFEEVAGVAYITWDNVIGYQGTAQGTVPSRFQFQFSLATGTVTFAFQSMDTVSVSGWGGGEGWVIGYSGPGANLDPGSTDLSALSAIVLGGTDTLPLALVGTTRPVTGSSWNLQVSNIPASGLVGVDVFGVSDPGINDLFFLGAPGCGLRASLDVTSAWFVAGATHTYSLPVPANPALLNLNVYTTSAVFQVPPVNALGAITANGVRGMIGNL